MDQATILVPDEYLGSVLKLCEERRGRQKDLSYAGCRALVVYELPLNEVVLMEHAFRFLYERAKLACEPAGAVATAAWLARKIDAANPVILVSGGNVAGQTAAAILARP